MVHRFNSGPMQGRRRTMDYYPLFMQIEDRTCVVIGGGVVAARKVEMLRRAGARVSIVAPDLIDELARLAERGSIDHRGRMFFPNQLDGAVLVIAATGNAAIDAQVARHARLRGLPVNVVDDAQLSSFVTPAVIDRSPVVVAVSTGGASPALARQIRARIEAALPPALGRLRPTCCWNTLGWSLLVQIRSRGKMP